MTIKRIAIILTTFLIASSSVNAMDCAKVIATALAWIQGKKSPPKISFAESVELEEKALSDVAKSREKLELQIKTYFEPALVEAEKILNKLNSAENRNLMNASIIEQAIENAEAYQA